MGMAAVPTAGSHPASIPLAAWTRRLGEVPRTSLEHVIQGSVTAAARIVEIISAMPVDIVVAEPGVPDALALYHQGSSIVS